MSRLYFLLLLMFGMTTINFATPPTTTHLTGIYGNVDKNTKSVTKVVISCKGEQLFIETFVKCKNQECNWRKTPLKKVSDNTYQAVYAQGFAKKTLTIVHKGQQLIIHIKRTYKDSRPTSTVKDLLKLTKLLKKC